MSAPATAASDGYCRTVIPMRRSLICVITGPLPALIMRWSVQGLMPLTSAHWRRSSRAGHRERDPARSDGVVVLLGA